MNNYLLDIDPKFTIEIITSDGYLSYSNKLSQSDALKAPNQNTSPEVMAAINFLWAIFTLRVSQNTLLIRN